MTQEELELLQEQASKLRAEVTHLEMKRASIKAGINELSKEQSGLEDQLADTKEELVAFAEENKTLRAKVKQLQAFYDSQKEVLKETLGSTIMDLRSELDDLQQKISADKIGYQDFIENLRRKEADLKEKELEINKNLEQIDTRSKLLDAKEQNLEDTSVGLSIWVEELKSKEKEINSTLNRVKSERMVADERNKVLIEAQMDKLDELEHQLKEVSQQKLLLSAGLRIVEKTKDHLDSQKRELEKEKAKVADDRVSVRSAWHELQNLKKDYVRV